MITPLRTFEGAWLVTSLAVLVVLGGIPSVCTKALSAESLANQRPEGPTKLSRQERLELGQMAVAQPGLELELGLDDPAQAIGVFAAVALAVAFASATQDIVIDAYRIESAETRLQGVLAASYQYGYRLALLVAGAGALYIAEYGSWSLASNHPDRSVPGFGPALSQLSKTHFSSCAALHLEPLSVLFPELAERSPVLSRICTLSRPAEIIKTSGKEMSGG